MVDVSGFSRELCGGTHCETTGQIGPFRVVSERGISAGVRRVEAVTGRVALQRFATGDRILSRLETMLSVTREKTEEALQRTLARQRELEREVDRLKLKLATAGPGDDLAQEVRQVNGIQILAREVKGLDRAAMRSLADSLKVKIEPGIVVLGSTEGKRVSLLVSVTEGLGQRVDARSVVRELALIVGGGGGGHATMAEAGGRNPERLDEALAAAPGVVEQLLEES